MIPSPKRARIGRANAGAPSSEASACEGKSALWAPTNVIAERTATAEKWGRGPTPREASSPPSAAPARPPKLQAAWKEDMIGRPYPLSTTTACAFIETSSPPFAAPRSIRAGTSKNRFGASAGVTSERESKSAVVPTTRRLPKRETKAPTSGMATSAPTAAPSSARPSSPSPRPSLSFTAGILTTQVPITTPLAKNTPSTAEPGHAQRQPVMCGRAPHNSTCDDEDRRGGSRTALTMDLVLERNIPAHVALDCAVVDDTGCGHVFQGEALASEEGYVLGAAAARHLSGDDLAELVDGLGEDGAGFEGLHQVSCLETELLTRVGAYEARPPYDLAVDLGLE